MTDQRSTTTTRLARQPATWLLPFSLILLLSVLLPAIYLSATIDPQRELKDFPIAMVVEPQTVNATSSPAQRVALGITENVAASAFDLVRVDGAELKRRMDNGTVYGAVVIPSSFDADIASLSPGQTARQVTPATIELLSNDHIGGVSTALFNANVSPVLTGVRDALAEELVASAASDGGPLSGVQRAVLRTPFTVEAHPFDQLPARSGLGTSAFYYALLLVLIGFLGASTVHPTVDAALGFTPNELGPVVRRRTYQAASRRHTLLIKMVVMIVAAPVAALCVQLVAGPVLGMPIDKPLELWLFASGAIAAIGASALTVFAVFGSLGALVNMIFFIALAMTSSGGAVPIEATPEVFRWLATFEPMHAVLEGVRSILYFGAVDGSGLEHAWSRVGIGALIGVASGVLVTSRFDQRPALSRHPEPIPTSTGPSGPSRRDSAVATR